MTRSLADILARHKRDCTEAFPASERLAWREAQADRAELLALIDELAEALERSRVAIDDWLHSYAPEFCNVQYVQETMERISAFGTIGYIAKVQEANRAALAKLGTDYDARAHEARYP